MYDSDFSSFQFSDGGLKLLIEYIVAMNLIQVDHVHNISFVPLFITPLPCLTHEVQVIGLSDVSLRDVVNISFVFRNHDSVDHVLLIHVDYPHLVGLDPLESQKRPVNGVSPIFSEEK